MEKGKRDLRKEWVARTGRRENRRKGAYTDFSLDDFSRNGTQRGMLKIRWKKGSYEASLFLCPKRGVAELPFLSRVTPPTLLHHCTCPRHYLKIQS